METKVILSEIIFSFFEKSIYSAFHEETQWQIQFAQLTEEREGRGKKEFKELPTVKMRNKLVKHKGFFHFCFLMIKIYQLG